MQLLLVLSGQKLRSLQKHVLATIFAMVFKIGASNSFSLLLSVRLFLLVILRLNGHVENDITS